MLQYVRRMSIWHWHKCFFLCTARSIFIWASNYPNRLRKQGGRTGGTEIRAALILHDFSVNTKTPLWGIFLVCPKTRHKLFKEFFCLFSFQRRTCGLKFGVFTKCTVKYDTPYGRNINQTQMRGQCFFCLVTNRSTSESNKLVLKCLCHIISPKYKILKLNYEKMKKREWNLCRIWVSLRMHSDIF